MQALLQDLNGLLLLGLLATLFVAVWSLIALVPIIVIVGAPAVFGRWRLARAGAWLLAGVFGALWAISLWDWAQDGLSFARRHSGIATLAILTSWPLVTAALITRYRLRDQPPRSPAK